MPLKDKKAAQQKAQQVIEKLKVMKLKEAAKKVEEAIAECGIQNEVIFTGNVPGSDIPYLYNGPEIVVFASLGIVWVMFPKVTSLYSKNEEHGHYLLYALVVISLVAGAIVSAYFLIPKFIVSTLFGVKYLPVAPYMGAFGVAMLLLSLSYALANYYLAIQETKYIYILTVAVVMQVVMISLFHSSIAQIVLVMNIVMSLMLIGLVLYYFVVILPQPTAKKA